METTKLKTVDYEFEGRTYRLVCNMNVLAPVQEAYNGDLRRALERRHGIKSTLQFLAAMLTEAARKQQITDDDGLPLQFTAERLGETLSWNETMEAGAKIWPLVEGAFWSAEQPEEQTGPQEEAEKN